MDGTMMCQSLKLDFSVEQSDTFLSRFLDSLESSTLFAGRAQRDCLESSTWCLGSLGKLDSLASLDLVSRPKGARPSLSTSICGHSPSA